MSGKKKRLEKCLGRQRVAEVEYTLTPSLTLTEVGVAKCAACVANVPFVTSDGYAGTGGDCHELCSSVTFPSQPDMNFFASS